MLILTPAREGMEVVDHGGPAAPPGKQVQAWPRKAELVCCAMNHLDHTSTPLSLFPQHQRCSFRSPPWLLAALQFHFVKLLSIFVLHQLLCSAMLNDCARMLFLVGL